MFKISFLEYHVHTFKWKNGIIFYMKTFDKLYSNLIIYLILLKKNRKLWYIGCWWVLLYGLTINTQNWYFGYKLYLSVLSKN